MLKLIVIAAVLCLGAIAAFANTPFSGSLLMGSGGGVAACATNFVFDWSVSTGCNAITAVIR